MTADNHETIEVELQYKPGCVVEMTVAAGKDYIEKAKKEALKALKKEIELPGFRKGRAPDSSVLKKYPGLYEQEWQKKLADLLFIAAEREKKAPVVTSESKIVFNIKKLTDTDAAFVFSFETEPKVPNIDPSSFILIEPKRNEIGKKEVDEAIRQSRFFFAKWTEVDRPVREGDYVILDVYAAEMPTPTKVLSDIRFEVCDISMAKWMKKLIMGAKTGDIVDGISAFDEEATEEERGNFQPKKVKIEIKKIEEAVLPELNDEFAKMMGSVSVEEMEKAIKEMLNRREEEKVLREKREKAAGFLIDTYTFDLPKSLIDAEYLSRKGNALKDERFKARYNKMSEDENKLLEAEIKSQAEGALRLFYITKQIVKDQKISISDEEIKNEAIHILHSQGITDTRTISRDVYALALSRLVLAKAEDYILAHSSKS